MPKIDETITVARHLTCGLVLTRGRFFYILNLNFLRFSQSFHGKYVRFFQTKLYFAWTKTLKIGVFRALYIKSLIILVAILRILQKRYFEKWGILTAVWYCSQK